MSMSVIVLGCVAGGYVLCMLHHKLLDLVDAYQQKKIAQYIALEKELRGDTVIIIPDSLKQQLGDYLVAKGE